MVSNDLGTGFTIRVNLAVVTPSAFFHLNVQGVPADEIWFDLATPLDDNDGITIEYDGSGNTQEFSSTLQLGAFAAQTVTNNVTALVLSPTNGATSVSRNTNLSIDFNNGVTLQKGTGTIRLDPVSPAGTPVDILVSSTEVSVAGDVVTINPTADLSPNTQYEITFPSGTFLATNASTVAANPPMRAINAGEWLFTTGALSVTAPSLTNICTGTSTYFDLADIVVNEGAVSHFATGAGQTFILDAPTGFEFEAGTGNIAFTGTDITGTPAINVTTSQITVTYDVSTVADLNTMTISGIKVRSTTASSSGNITRSGGTATQVGNTVGDALVHASLSSNANTCPEVNTYTPNILATNVAIGDNLVLNFNTNVAAGVTGNITITPLSPAGSDIVIPIGDAQVTIGGGNSTVTINPTSDLANFTQYEVKIDAGAIVGDGTGETFGGIAAGAWTFTTADLVLALSSSIPVDNSTDIAKTTNIVLTYNTNIAQGAGNITIRNMTDGVNLPNILVSDAQVSISGNTLTLNLTSDLDPNKEYRVRMDAGAILRASDNSAGPAITGNNLTFETAITQVSFSPANGSVNVAVNDPLTVTYDAQVTNGSGNVILRDLTNTSSVNINAAALDYSGTNTATRNSPGLNPNTEYEIEIPAGVIAADGGAGSTVPAVAANTWRFTTASGITGTPNSPAHNANNVTIGTTSLVIDYSANVAKGASGTIVVQAVGGGAQNINVLGANVAVSGSQVTITVSALAANTQYTVAIPDGAFVAATGAGATVPEIAASSWTFTTASSITLASTTPTDNATNIATSANLVLNFSGNVQAGMGNIVLKNITDGAASDQNINVAGAAISGGQVTLTNGVAFTLLANTQYEVVFADGVLEDASGANGYVAGLPGSGATRFRFTTESGYTGTPTTPANGAVNVGVSTNPLITFDNGASGAIQKGVAGKKITINRLTAPTSSTVLDITDANVTITGGSSNQLLITIPDLDLGAQYEILIDDGAVLAAGRAQAEITGIAATQWRFTTVNGVSITAPAVTTCIGGDFVNIDPIVITESSVSSFSSGATQQLILSVPTNYEMEAGVGSVIVTGSEIINASLVVATNTITVQYDITGTDNINSIIINGLRVKANTFGPGSITYNASSTAVQQGNTTGTVHATLTSSTLPSNPTLSQTIVNLCQNTNISTQTVTASGVFTVRWYSDATLNNLLYTGSSANLQTDLGINSANTGTTTFYVTRYNGTCEGTSTTLTVNVNAEPVVSLISSDADNIICEGESITFTAVSTPTGATYAFKDGATTVQTGGSATYTTAALTDGAHSITVEVTTTNGCVATSSPAISVTVNEVPTVAYVEPSSNSFPNTQTDAVALTDGSTYGGTVGGTIQATNIGSYSGAGVIGTNFYPDVAGDGNHTITYTYADGNGCSNSATFTVTVFNPNGTINNLNSSYCENDAISGNLSPVIGAGTLFPATETRTQTIKIPNPNPFVGGKINVTFTSVYTRAATFTMDTGVEGIQGTGPYQFNPGLITFGTDQTSKKVTVKATYIYVNTSNSSSSGLFPPIQVSGPAYEKTARVDVTVTKLPTLTLSGLSPAYCTDVTSVTLDPRADGDAISSNFTISYQRITPTVGSIQSLAANIKAFNPSVLADGTYRMFFTYTTGGCTVTSPDFGFDVDAIPVPAFTFPLSATSYSTCINNAVTLSPTDGGAAITGGNLANMFFEVQVNKAGAYIPLAAGETTITPSVFGTGTHNVRMTYTNAAGCKVTTTVSRELTVNALPIPQFASGLTTASYCVSVNAVTITPQDNGTNITGASLSNVIMSIDQGADGSFTDQTPGDITFDPSALGEGTHQIKFRYTNSNGCLEESGNKTIVVFPLPAPNFAESDLTYCADVTSATITLRDGTNNLVTTQLNNATILVRLNSSGAFVTPPVGSVTKTIATSTVTINPQALGATVAGFPHQIQFTYTDGNSCVETTPVVLNVTVNALPTPNISFVGPTTFCVNGGNQEIDVRDATAPLTAAQLARVTFEVDKGSGYGANSGEVIIDFANAKVYAVPTLLGDGNRRIRMTYINDNGCQQITGNLSFMIDPEPIPNITGIPAGGYCVNSTTATINLLDNTTPLTATQLSGGRVTFELNKNGAGFVPALGTEVSISGSTVSIHPNVIGEGGHQIRFTYQDNNNCTKTSGDVPFTVHPLPVLSFTGLDAAYCFGAGNVLLQAFDGANNLLNNLATVDFFISNNNGTSFSTAPTSVVEIDAVTAKTITFKPAGLPAGNNYQLKFEYTDGNGCKTESPAIPFVIHELPQATITIVAGATAYCELDGTAQLRLTDVTTGTNLNNNAGGELSRVTFEVQVNSMGAYQPVVAEVRVIPGDPVSDSRVLLDPVELAKLGKDQTHNIRFTYTDANGCVDVSDPIAITIHELPVPQITSVFSASTSTGFCTDASTSTLTLQDDGTNITIDVAGSNVTFEIDYNRDGNYVAPTGATFTLVDGTNQVTFDPTTVPVGQHNVRFLYRDGNSCQNYSVGYPIEIWALPTLTLSGLGTNQEFCADAANILLSTDNNGNNLLNDLANVSFFISSNGGTSFSAAPTTLVEIDAVTAKTITFKPSSLTPSSNAPGVDYQLKFRYTDGNGCVNESAAIPFIVHPLPQPSITIVGAATAYCELDGTAQLRLTDITTGTNLNNNAGGELSRVTFEVQVNSMGAYQPVVAEVRITPGAAASDDRVLLDPVELAKLGKDQTHNIRFRYVDANGCTDVSTPIAITIHELPVPQITSVFSASTNTGFCTDAATATLTLQDDGTNITINTTTGNVTFEVDYDRDGSYSTPTAGTFTLINGTNQVTFDPTKVPVGQHNVRFLYRDGNSCQNYSVDYPIEIWALPNLTLSGLTTNQEFCADAANILLSTDNNGNNLLNDLANVSFFISSNGGTSFSAAPTTLVEIDAVTAKTITFKPSSLTPSSNAPGVDYQLKFRYTDGNGCVNESAAIPFIVHPLPQPSITIVGAATAYCELDGTAQLRLTDITTGTNLNNNAGGELSRVTFEVQVNSMGAYQPVVAEVRITPGAAASDDRVLLDPVELAKLGKDQTHNIRFRYVDANGCTDVSTPIAITIHELPVPVINGLVAGYCTDAPTTNVTLQDDGVNITINTTTNNVVFEIDPGRTGAYTTTLPTGSITLNNGTNQVTIDPTRIPVGTYNIRYRYTDGNTCSQYSIDYPIEIYPLPSLKIIGMSAEYCIDNPDVTLRAENNGNDLLNDLSKVSFSISTNGGPFNAPGGAVVVDAAGKTITFKPSQLAANNYRIRYFYTDANLCDDYSDTLSFVIHPLPVPTIDMASGTAPYAYCVDAGQQELTIRNNGVPLTTGELANAIFTIDKGMGFSTNNGEVVKTGNQAFIAPSVLTVGTHKIRYRYTDANTCVQTSNELTVTINRLPTPVINSIDATGYCESETSGTLTLQENGANITINVATNNVVFQVDTTGAGFTPPPTGGITLVDGTNQVILNPNKFPTGVHRIRYTYTDGNGCVATSSDATTFEVLQLPTLTFTGLNATYCNDDAQIQLRAFNNGNVLSPPNGAFTISTDNVNFAANSAIDANTHILDPSKLTPGIYWIRYEFTDVSLCSNLSASQQVEIFFSPGRDLDFTFTNTCFGDDVAFTATASGITSQWKWEWDFGDGGRDTTQNPTHKFPTFASFQVTLTATSQNGCSFTIQKTVTVTPVPTADFSSAGFCLGSPTQFTDQSTVSQPGQIVRWFWDFGDGNTSTLQNPSHSYAAAGTYTVTLRVETLGSVTTCTNTISKTVYIFPYVTVTSTNTYLESFESSDGGWIAYGTNSSWQHGTPAGSKFDATAGNVWATNLTGTYNNNESSWVESPCFNIDGMSKPVVNLRYWVDTDINFDGAVLLVTLDDGVNWEVLGTVSSGIDWYNKTGILGNPGQQSAAQASWNGNIIGWAGDTDTTWKVAKFPLDLIKARLDANPNDNLKTVRFRVAFGSDASSSLNSQLDGFAFDNFFIGERNRVALLEHFTNSSNTVANNENVYVDTTFTVSDPEVVKIEYHTEFPGVDVLNQDNNAAPSARALYYGVAVTPRTVLDGVAKDSAFSTYGQDDYNTRILEASPFNISMDFAGSSPTSLNVQATVNAINNSVVGPLIIHVVVIEREISGVGTTGLTFKNVVKKMLPSAAGTLVDWTTGKTSEVITQSWTLDKIYDNKQVAVVVFIQDDMTKEVYQAAIGDPTSFLRTGNGGGQAAGSGKVTGVADELQHDFIVYPNPATTKVYVGYKSYAYKEDTPFMIYDKLGKVITSGTVQKGKNGVVINTQQWAEGVYHIILTASDGSKTSSKIVKH
ncbi:hypothetical protein BKI52_33355 [marine bacterium AO1-C]|nr:hypothetical protein BKI52_33355 [marine bacterium AO1-C]